MNATRVRAAGLPAAAGPVATATLAPVQEAVTATATTLSAELAEANRTTMQVQDFVSYYSKQVENNEPLYMIECPATDIIEIPGVLKNDSKNPKSRLAKKNLKSVREKVKISWEKDGKPFKKRMNGNRFDIMDNGFTLVLYQTGSSDEGTYTCRADFSAVPQHLWDLYTFHRGVNVPIEFPVPPPDIAPSVSNPPKDAFVYSGSSVDLTCESLTTMSVTRTTWYKSCSFSKNSTTCLEDFLAAFDKAKSSATEAPLSSYKFNDENLDVLHIINITEDKTGLYACAVTNNLGTDVRLAKVALPEDWPYPPRVEQVRQQQQPATDMTLVWLSIGISSFLMVGLLLALCVYIFKISMKRDKKQSTPLISSTTSSDSSASRDSRQRLPNIEAPDIYNTGKSIDGFITGHFSQEPGHLMAQSIFSGVLNKVNPSISSSNSHQSDEASSSWGKSMSSGGDHSRTFYSPASNATATTVPLYDHPPSTRAVKNSTTFVQNSCVSNPSYWLLNPDNDSNEWTFPRRNLERVDKIGEGQFGEVWRYIARHKDGTGHVVAVKRLKDDLCASDGERAELRAEIEIMKTVNNHPNVIKLLHCCTDDCGPVLLIMEYAEHGKLQAYLRGCRSHHRQRYDCMDDQRSRRLSITSKELIKFTYHIAKGMEYVASLGIVHRDLASRNILVSKDKICKVADFGFARRVDEECVYVRKSTNPVPVKWMAPEALEGNKFTFKSDVFSLGVLMWEIVTLGATPYEQMTSEGVYKKVTTGGRLERPPHCRDEFFSLMDQCWMHDPAQRPTFKQVAEQLEKLLLSENDYIELDQYPEHAYYNIVNGAEKEVVHLSD